MADVNINVTNSLTAHQGGHWTILHIGAVAHISSVVHIQVAGAGIPAASLSVRCVNTGGTSFEACGGAGAAADSVNVFHQSTVRHVSSVVHVAAADGGLVIRDPLNAGARARVDHTGALVTSATVTVTTDNINVFHQSTIRHVSSEVHVAGAIMVRDKLCATCVARVDHTGALVTSASVTTTVDNVNVFHQSTIRHVSSVVHVAAADGGLVIRDPINAGARARVDHTGALVTTATVTTTVDNVNVFHQSTVRHISSVTHIASAGLAIANQALAVRCVDTGGTTFQACGGGSDPASVVQSSSWTIQALHQAVVSHISSVVHVASYGALHIQGRGTAGDSHGGVLTVQGVTGMNPVVVSQATAANLQVTATQTGTYAVTQSGTWTVQPGNTPNTTAWLANVQHVSSAVHITGRVILSNVAGTAVSVTGSSLDANITNATLAVTQSGTWTVQPGNTVNTSPWLANIFHVSSQVHVIGRVILQNVAGTAVSVTSTSLDTNITNTTLAVTQSGTWTVQPGNTPNTTAWLVNVGHVASVLHIQVAGAGIPGASLSVRCVNTGGTAFADCGGAGGSGDAVNVFHQSTVRHISSVTHVAGAVSLVNQAGTYVTLTSSSLDVNVTNSPSVAQSGTWTMQPGNTVNTAAWLVNVGHVSSQLHINIAGVGGLPVPTSQGLPIQHIASVVHIAASGLGTPTQALSVRCVNTGATAFADCGGAGGSGDAVNVFHQSTVRHISSVTHVAGGVSLVNQAGSYATFTGNSLDVNVTTATLAVTQSGTWTVQPGNTVNTGAWLVNIGHASGALHIAAIHSSGVLRAWRVAQCGTTATLSIATNQARREIWLTNMGTSNIYLGYGATGHVALTTSNGWPMHAASASTGLAYPVKLKNYYGPIACITDNGSQQLGVMEILRN